MTVDQDVWRCAHLLIQRYGARAEFDAAARADAMTANGDRTGEAVWKRVLAAIRELQRTAPREGEAVN